MTPAISTAVARAIAKEGAAGVLVMTAGGRAERRAGCGSPMAALGEEAAGELVLEPRPMTATVRFCLNGWKAGFLDSQNQQQYVDMLA